MLARLHIPLNPATDSERIQPPLGAPQRRSSSEIDWLRGWFATRGGHRSLPV